MEVLIKVLQYYHIGIMMGIEHPKNGQHPCCMPLETIDNLTTVTKNKCISNIQRGLDVFWSCKRSRGSFQFVSIC